MQNENARVDEKKLNERKQLLQVVSSLGVELLRNGAEIYRVEDALRYVLSAYQAKDYDVYILSNGIFICVDTEVTVVQQAVLGDMNLERIARLNQVARDLTEQKCSLDCAKERIESIKEYEVDSLLIKVVACGVGCSAFCYLFGGRWMDLFFAFLNGQILELFLQWKQLKRTARFIRRFFLSAMVTILSVLPWKLGFPVWQDKIIIAGIIPLLPGVAFTTSVRDFFHGDYLSGVIHLADALLVAFAVAAGVGVILAGVG